MLRVVVTISNVAASAVAAVSEPVTQRTGLFMLAAFCGERDEMIFGGSAAVTLRPAAADAF